MVFIDVFKMKKIALIFSLVLLLACQNKTNHPLPLSSGIDLELANYRVKQVSDVIYYLDFKIPEAKQDPIPAQLKLKLNIQDLKESLYVDFNADANYLKQVEVNDSVIPVHHELEHLVIDSKYLKKGSNTINIRFLAGELSLNRNHDYLYTLLVPDRASTLFPCFDQPNIKAKYVLSITAPKDWQVLSGAPLDKKEEQGSNTHYRFKTSDLMSTYLFSFVAGKFNTVHQASNPINMTMLYREDNAERLKASTNTIFNLHSESVKFLEAYTQYKFPFQKMDLAVIPDFQYGGMEHVGAIQYRESKLFLDSSATQKQALSRCKLIAHETAHMWFGNLVTMNWFDDVWLKEVFANFLADKISEPIFPEVNHRLNFMNEHYPSAYSEDRTKGATPIKQYLDNLKNAGTLYGRIIYNKSPIMMRQLEALLGQQAFKTGMRNYIKTFANANADWNDLVTLLDAQTHHDLNQWSKVWVNQSGRPIITDKIQYANGKIEEFVIKQHAEDGSDKVWPQQFNIGLVYPDSVRVVPVNLIKKTVTLNALKGVKKPKAIIYNYDAVGYGVFPLSKNEANEIPIITDDVARGYSYINLYENVLTGTINPMDALAVFTQAILTEQNEIILSTVNSYVSALFWRFISVTDRASIAPKLILAIEERLGSGLVASSMKKTLFNLYQRIGYTPASSKKLYGIWSKSIQIDGLALNETDFTNLASALALYNYPKSDSILKVQLQHISNPDRKKRFEYLLPALSNNPNDRANFIKALTKAENREKENWVATGLNYIHHPLRQETSIKYLRRCLDLVEDIQQTGDIFFPKAWLKASIGNYTSQEAYLEVERFLKENPNFPLSLKNKLLQAADGVYRAKYKMQ